MIRFLPDTWRETILRPLAMAAPDAGVYIEIMAPDFRFAIAGALMLVLAALWPFRRGAYPTNPKPALVLVSVIAAAFLPWLGTTANGRYFIPFLLAIGPLCIALIFLLPATQLFRFSIAACVVGLQGFSVQQASPWQSWGLAQWKEAPYFKVDWPADLATIPADFVTLSTISYSLFAPQLPAQARWMSLANAPAASNNTADSRRAQEFLANAKNLKLLAPSIPEYSTSDGRPDTGILNVIDTQLGVHHLALSRPADCRLVRSHGLASMALRREALADVEKTRRLGFWVCSLQRTAGESTGNYSPSPTKFDAVFEAIETQCPRFFPRGQTGTRVVPGGEMRAYSASEMKLYVLDDGMVLYKYYRAFTPVRIGTREEVLNGRAKVDCNNIRGRSGLPWEREI